MRQTFDDLRALAKKKRDQAIKAARKEYTVAIQEIATLEGRLAPPPPVERPRTNRSYPLIDLIVDSLPRDRTFCIDDVHGWVHAKEPERNASKPTVRTNIHRLLRQGVVKRISGAEGNKRATFAVAALEVDREPTLREYADRVLAEADGPLEVDKLLVRMMDAGYQPDCDPKTVMGSLKRLLSHWNAPGRSGCHWPDR